MPETVYFADNKGSADVASQRRRRMRLDCQDQLDHDNERTRHIGGNKPDQYGLVVGLSLPGLH